MYYCNFLSCIISWITNNDNDVVQRLVIPTIIIGPSCNLYGMGITLNYTSTVMYRVERQILNELWEM